MSKVQDQVRAAQGLLNPDGSRKYSDEEIYQKVLSTETGKKALAATNEGALQEYLGLKIESPQDPNPVTRTAKMVGGALLEGAGAIVGLPGSVLHATSDLLSPLGWGQSPDSPLMKIPTGGDINDFTRGLGLTSRADAEPQNLGERALEGGAEGLGASLPLLAIPGGASLSPEFVSAGIASGEGETVANELFPGNPIAGLVGSVLGGVGGQGLAKRIGEGLAKSNVTRSLDELTKSWGDLTANEAMARQTAAAARDKVIAAADEAFKRDVTSADAAQIAAQAGPLSVIEGHAARLNPLATGWQDAGEHLRESVGKWYNESLPKQLDAVWEPLNKAIPKDAPVKLDNFGRILDSIDKKAGAAQPLVDRLVPGLPSGLKKTLANIVDGQITAGLPGFTWDNIKTLRTALGDAMRNPKIMPDIGENNLRALYAGLTEDLRNTAKTAGAEPLFDAANEASKKLFATAEGPVRKVLDPAKSPGDVAKGLASKARVDATDLATLREIAPVAVDSLAAAGLKIDDWNKYTPAAKAQLIPDPTMRREIEFALAQLNETKSASGIAKSAAKAGRDATVLAAKEGHKNWTTASAAEKAALKRELDSARAEEKKFLHGESSTAAGISKLVQLGTGGAFGGALGMGLEMLGLHPAALAGSSLGGALAVGVPAVMHGTAELIKHPDLAAGPLIGLTTHNALQPGAQEQAGQ